MIKKYGSYSSNYNNILAISKMKNNTNLKYQNVMTNFLSISRVAVAGAITTTVVVPTIPVIIVSTGIAAAITIFAYNSKGDFKGNFG